MCVCVRVCARMCLNLPRKRPCVSGRMNPYYTYGLQVHEKRELRESMASGWRDRVLRKFWTCAVTVS